MSSSSSVSSCSSSSLSRNWQYEVFISFRGEDVRHNFFSHFLKELDRKLITIFKDMEIKKGETLGPVLTQAIRGSRIAVVLFSKNYASSGWCLNELLEIMQCKKEIGQVVIPIFHGVDPSHVRKQTDHFGNVFQETCNGKTEELKNQWKTALTEVADLVGSHIHAWDDEANRIEVIVKDLLGRLITPSKDFEKLVGIEDHIANMSLMFDLKSESKEVRMVGIWGPSGIGKTTIARALYSQYSDDFDVSVFLDRAFVSQSIQGYSKSNPTDYNMKLCLQSSFLSQILDQKDITVHHLGSVGERLKHKKVLIVLDDLNDQVVLATLAGETNWFGCGSRIIVVTKDKHLLEARKIDLIYIVSLPSEKQALEMLCRSAFNQKSPPDDFMELATEVAAHAGGLPLGLEILGKVMNNRDKKYWMDMLTRLRRSPNKAIEKTLRFSYDELDSEADKAIFRHVACFFNGVDIKSVKLMLAESKLDVDIGLPNLVNMSLISEKPSWNNTNIVDMHCLVEEMGKNLVRAQSNKPGEREFLFDSEDVCDVLVDRTGTKSVLGISLNVNEIEECTLDEKAFQGMRNLRFLRFYTNAWEQEKGVEWDLPERFDDFPQKLKLLSWPGYPLKEMPSKFRPDNLVELRMPSSKILEELWEGVKSLKYLKDMDLSESQYLKKIPDLSKATNLETLNLHGCSSLVELPSSILNLNKLKDLNMAGCTKLEALPTGDLESLICLNLAGCSQLKIFPDISNKSHSLL